MSSSLPPDRFESRPAWRNPPLVLAAGIVCLLAALWGITRWGADERAARRAFAKESGSLTFGEITGTVEVMRDDRGIPHIEAQNEHDAWVALGFVHAQDRLAQMFWLRRIALGRTSERRGDSGLHADRLARTLGIGLLSDAAVEALDARSRELLEAYAFGVNERLRLIDAGSTARPLYLDEAGGALERWTPRDSIAIEKLLSWCAASSIETVLVLEDLKQRLASVGAKPFFPGPAGLDIGLPFELPETDPRPPHTGSRPKLRPAPGDRLCRSVRMAGGSAFVLSGRHTKSKSPLLVADYHLTPTVPSLLHEAHVRGTGLDVAGATIPGLPVFWAGRNLDVAWAVVPSRAVVADLYVETVRDEEGLYRDGSLWVPLDERIEQIVVGGRDPQTVEWKVRSTRHGPLLGPLLEKAGLGSYGEAGPGGGERRPPLALAWTGALPGNGIRSMLDLVHARDGDDVLEALAHHHEPVSTVTWADDQGNAGVKLAGWLPNRRLPTGLSPVQGRLRIFDWRDPVEPESLPGGRIGPKGSGRGWLIAADNALPGETDTGRIEWLWRSGREAARLDKALADATRDGRIDLRTAAEIQDDQVAAGVTNVVGAALAIARGGGALPAEADEIARLLTRWDGSMSRDSQGAAAYQLLIQHLIDELLAGPFGESLLERYLELPHVHADARVEDLLLRTYRLQKRGGWTDRERVEAAVRKSLRKTWVSLSNRLGPNRDGWRWGMLHSVTFRHFARPFREAAAGTGFGPFAVGGDVRTPDHTSHHAGLDFDVDHLSSYRLAVDLAAPDRMLSLLAPGQSEHPEHGHYADGIVRWQSGRVSLFATHRLRVEEESRERLVLEKRP